MSAWNSAFLEHIAEWNEKLFSGERETMSKTGEVTVKDGVMTIKLSSMARVVGDTADHIVHVIKNEMAHLHNEGSGHSMSQSGQEHLSTTLIKFAEQIKLDVIATIAGHLSNEAKTVEDLKAEGMKALGIRPSEWQSRGKLYMCTGCGVTQFRKESVGSQCPLTACGGIVRVYTLLSGEL